MATVIVNRPNFLYSERSLVLKTVGLYDGDTSATAVSETDADGCARKVVKAGTIYVNATSGMKGLIFEDIDVTGSTATTQVEGSLMVAGHYINDATVLPAKVAGDTLTAFAAAGLIAHSKDSVTRPVFEEAVV